MPSDADTHFNQDTEMFVATVMSCLPATEKRLTEITQKQEKDEVCKQLKNTASQDGLTNTKFQKH